MGVRKIDNGKDMKYDIGDIIKINIKNKVYNAIIINTNMVISQPAYEYIIQGIENKTFWDLQSHLETRELEAINMLLETASKDHEI